MSWKRTIKGTFSEARNKINDLAEDVRAKQGKVTAENESSVNAHAMQARIAQLAAGEITARHSAEENFVLNVSGDVDDKGGSVTIEYSFAKPKAKKGK